MLFTTYILAEEREEASDGSHEEDCGEAATEENDVVNVGIEGLYF